MPNVSQAHVEKYRRFSLKLADPQVLEGLKHRFIGKPELPTLLEWLHSKLRWSKHGIKRHSHPLEILAYGKGRCREFSILFTALCLAHNIRARLILDLSDHVWTEVWSREEERWIHVDPSERRVDDPYMYERDWKKKLDAVWAFEKGRAENVTKRYKLVET